MADGALLVGPFKAKPETVVLSMTVTGDPLSKQRPRWNRKTHTMYTPSETRHREEGIAALARLANRELVVDSQGLFSLRVGFHLGSQQRRDVDNMLKLISDALTGVVWADDSQVVEMFAYKQQADPPSDAKTDVAVCRLPGTIPHRTKECLLCRRVFKWYPSWRFRQFCSLQCSSLGQRRREPVVCAHCKKPFDVPLHRKRTPHKHYFCSRDCKTAFGREERICAVCGATFSAPISVRKATCSRTCATTKRWRP